MRNSGDATRGGITPSYSEETQADDLANVNFPEHKPNVPILYVKQPAKRARKLCQATF